MTLQFHIKPVGIDGRKPCHQRLGLGPLSGLQKTPYGPIGAACEITRRTGAKVAQAHLRHLNPFPSNLGEVLRSYDKVIVPEMNLGQLTMLLRAKYLVDITSVNQVRGMPFKSTELVTAITDALESM